MVKKPPPAYTVVPLSNAYASSVGNLDNASPLVSTVNCVQAGGNTAYAEAVDAAYAELQADGRPNAQKAIVILSDGAANTGPSQLPATSPYRTTPCGQGVTSAGIAKADKVLVYSIAYTAQGDSCWASVGADVGSVTRHGSGGHGHRAVEPQSGVADRTPSLGRHRVPVCGLG